jgi:cytoskeletal protein CcmA (bactofilin family)/ribosomal protein S27E
VASNVSRAGGRLELETPTRPATSALPTPGDVAYSAGVVAGPALEAGTLKPLNSTSTVPLRTVEERVIPSLDVSETGELGLGALMRAMTEPSVAPAAPPAPSSDPVVDEFVAPSAPLQQAAPVSRPLGSRLGSLHRGTAAVPISGEPAAASGDEADAPTTLQKMKDQGFYRQQYFKEAVCFDCENKFKVGRSSRSANCPNCGALISLEDVELNMPSTQPIRTRGDVLIRKRGQLSASHLYARELRCFGIISANMFCAGDAIFRTSGTIVGELRCRRFVVEKGSEITFMNPIHAEEVEIHSPITATVYSKGPLLIGAHGAVNGDVTAKSVSIEPGGELNGSMNIIRSSAVSAPAAQPSA